jgi:hypothetical protein
MGQANFPGERAGGFFFQNPETETKERPQASVADKFRPGFFLGERPASEESGYSGIGKHGAEGGKIFSAGAAKEKARGFESREFGVWRERLQNEAP